MRPDLEEALSRIESADARELRKFDAERLSVIPESEAVVLAIHVTHKLTGGPLVLTSNRLIYVGGDRKQPVLGTIEAPLSSVDQIELVERGTFRKTPQFLYVRMNGTDVQFMPKARTPSVTLFVATLRETMSAAGH